MITMTDEQVKENQPTVHTHSRRKYKPTTALYHCEECDAWWGKDVYPGNPLARYTLFLTHEFSWENYYGWHTGQGIDHVCTICGHPNPQMFTI